MTTNALGAAILAVLLLGVPAHGHAQGAAPPAFRLGTDSEAGSFSGRWIRLIYTEAFRRLQLPLEFVVLPSPRLSALVDTGALDGDVLRVRDYAAAHPQQVRVDEPVLDVVFSLYATRPDVRPARLDELAGSGWVGEYRRGVELCAATLKRWLPAESVSEVATTEQAVRKLVAGRTDLYCELDLALVTALADKQLRDTPPPRRVLDIAALPLHAYLQRRNAQLAQPLAAVLRRMKEEGLIERYREQAQAELLR